MPSSAEQQFVALNRAAELIIRTEVQSPVPNVNQAMTDAIRAMTALTLSCGSAPDGTVGIDRESLKTFSAHQEREQRFHVGPALDPLLQGEQWIAQLRAKARIFPRTMDDHALFNLAINMCPAVRSGAMRARDIRSATPSASIPHMYLGLVSIAEHAEMERWMRALRTIAGPRFERKWTSMDPSERLSFIRAFESALEIDLLNAFDAMKAKDPAIFSQMLNRLHGSVVDVFSAQENAMLSMDGATAKAALNDRAFTVAWMLLLDRPTDDPHVLDRMTLSREIHAASWRRIERPARGRPAIPPVPPTPPAPHDPSALPVPRPQDNRSESRYTPTMRSVPSVPPWETALHSSLPERLHAFKSMPRYSGTTHQHIAEIFERVTGVSSKAPQSPPVAGHGQAPTAQTSVPAVGERSSDGKSSSEQASDAGKKRGEEGKEEKAKAEKKKEV